MSARKLEGKVAIVTGAARGIGGATAVELAANGAAVVMADLKPPSEACAVTRKIEEGGGRYLYIQGDVANRERDAALVEQAVSHFGRLDILVNNAALSIRNPFLKYDLEDARRTFEVIFWAGFTLSQLAARQMVSQGGGGAIVFISSVHAVRGYANAVAYNAAKAAVNHLARTIALELAPHRIRVNWIEPGWIDTPGEHIAFGDEYIEREGRKLLWGRLGTPEEMARGVVFLASDDSSYMTGACLRMDGGYVLGSPDIV
ncbi:MAG: SDR family oxidoreductase [Bryobacterales bacterium]|nr:SDR family oxidoreductase [Bryobacterales bacterium]